ncbi:hypothetical protein EDD65_10820 [Keratinibaculum paraultunense]|uniref:Uncharacterized protein n=1 Tax=Keratinibaculum paraultunense TaxID=1278232 RepID=A0A4R3KTA2_9FIRM|nr:hypothetical protein [Keratinibaculum paraultunense]QQY79106.1 hypothetical protein JL105_07895 [Keratinibaculum paraultunense]TCS88488.1 hypothetical protein EDD65_10820 [Keratinibaculum paraultunense]
MTNEEFQTIVLKELKTLREDVSGLKNDMVGVREDVSGLKNDMAGVKEDVSGLKNDMVGVREDVSGLKGRVYKIENKLDKMDDKLNAVYEQTAFLTEFKEESNKKNEGFEQENRRLKEIVGRHELEIQALKEKIG